jgi:Protein of unknown function (DUF2783)
MIHHGGRIQRGRWRCGAADWGWRMGRLETESRLPDPDQAYRMLIEAHRGLSDEESATLNTRLVLILANHIADAQALAEAITLAKQAEPSGR